jgi:hypothetical protein
MDLLHSALSGHLADDSLRRKEEEKGTHLGEEPSRPGAPFDSHDSCVTGHRLTTLRRRLNPFVVALLLIWP